MKSHFPNRSAPTGRQTLIEMPVQVQQVRVKAIVLSYLVLRLGDSKGCPGDPGPGCFAPLEAMP